MEFEQWVFEWLDNVQLLSLWKAQERRESERQNKESGRHEQRWSCWVLGAGLAEVVAQRGK